MYLAILTLFIALVISNIFAALSRRHCVVRDPEMCPSLIAGNEILRLKPNKFTPYQARSIPNLRHLRTFGIHSAFTTADEVSAQQFREEARNMINLSAYQWCELATHSQTAVHSWQEMVNTSEPKINLVQLVQALTLHVVLCAFFSSQTRNDYPIYNYGQFDLHFIHLVKLAREINRAWIASKNESTLRDFHENEDLQAALLKVLPGSKVFDPHKNPLRIMLPGFETLWRIVMRSFMEIGYKTGREQPTWREAMVAYTREPTAVVFSHLTGEMISAKFLVMEALRLYPPTKRIYRAWKEKSIWGSDHVDEYAADIEACHMNKEIWGPNVMVFDPMRWTKATDKQKRAFLPFGSKPFECPARPVFGPMIIGILTGTLLDAFGDYDDRWILVSENGVMAEFGGSRLDNGRDAYNTLALLDSTKVPCSYCF